MRRLFWNVNFSFCFRFFVCSSVTWSVSIKAGAMFSRLVRFRKEGTYEDLVGADNVEMDITDMRPQQACRTLPPMSMSGDNITTSDRNNHSDMHDGNTGDSVTVSSGLYNESMQCNFDTYFLIIFMFLFSFCWMFGSVLLFYVIFHGTSEFGFQDVVFRLSSYYECTCLQYCSDLLL